MSQSKPSILPIRESLVHLAGLLDERGRDQDAQWYDALGNRLEELERALGDGASEPGRSESLSEIRRAHPRLISLCGEFQRGGRRLLRQAALVVRLSARNFDVGRAPHTELHTATESLIDAVNRHLALEAELNAEAGRDLGGEG